MVGNVVIDGKVDDKGGAPETSAKEQRKKKKRGSRDRKKISKEKHQSKK